MSNHVECPGGSKQVTSLEGFPPAIANQRCAIHSRGGVMTSFSAGTRMVTPFCLIYVKMLEEATAHTENSEFDFFTLSRGGLHQSRAYAL